MPLTNFQEKSRKEVEAFLQHIPEIEFKNFQQITGKKETYLKSNVTSSRHSVEVFIYEDELGYLIDGGEWVIFERADYDVSSELLKAFMAGLSELLM